MLGRDAPDWAYYAARRAGKSRLEASLEANEAAFQHTGLSLHAYRNPKNSLEACRPWEARPRARAVTSR